MKNILIAGANSYVGTSFEKYIDENYKERYAISTVDMTDETWRKNSFSRYDSVFYVAGIAHSDNGKISADKKKLYYAVNTNLTIEAAKKAKSDGARQFIFMSSSIVYGNSAPIGKRRVITKNTPASPANCYGDSKLQAEKGLLQMEDANFRVVILRPPMIYGKGCRGNYPKLSKLAQRLPVFPYIKNERSMLYIGNLVEFVRLMIENDESGIFWPQNEEYSNTSELVRAIGKIHGKRVFLIGGFSWCVKFLSRFVNLVNKGFGSLCYEQSMSCYEYNYCIYDLVSSIEKTESE